MSGSGRQSPSPSTQTSRQLHDTPASGKGIDETPNKEKKNEEGLEVGHHSIQPSHYALGANTRQGS